MGDVPLVALLVAVLGSGGVTAVVTTIISSIGKARSGVATREDQRKTDIVRARDDAIREAAAADARADRERVRRIIFTEHAARQRMKLINAGLEPDAWPEETTEDPRA